MSNDPFAVPTPVGPWIRTVYKRLWDVYGPQNWWPARTTTEVVVGAILTQNTAWNNVVRAIENLYRADCLSWESLRKVSTAELARLIKPSGTYRVKAKRLKAFVEALWWSHHGSLRSLLRGDVEEARSRLLAIHGIGPETADTILLYAGRRPTFVIDAYTRRILRRHFIFEGNARYEDLRRLFQQALPPDPQRYNEYHALLVAVGKHHCRAQARCEGCPLADLPHDPMR